MKTPPSANSASNRDTHGAEKHEGAFASGEPNRDFKGRTIRGGLVTISNQFFLFVVSMASMVVLARLLSPEDYGIVGMVAAVIGFLGLIKDSGLSAATIQRETVTKELVSTVFWINIALGVILTAFTSVLAPMLVAFYREPRLYGITVALAGSFLIDAAGAQHMALLRRQMRMNAIAAIDVVSNVICVIVGIVMALLGFEYWALVAMPLSRAFVNTLAVWIVEPWRPGLPRRGSGARSMLRFGGYLTGVHLLSYSVRNVDNVLIGWYWGATSLGLYQKAYSLLMLPISQVNTPIGGVAISALSRIQSDSERYRRYFIGGYTIAASIILPILIASTIYAEDIIRLILGEQWISAAGLFRLLVPAALIGALVSPVGWLFQSSGRVGAQFVASLVWAPLMFLAFGIGVHYGPEGVALGYSAMSVVLAIPLCLFAVKGTSIRSNDMARALKYPAIAGAVAGVFGFWLMANIPDGVPTSVRAVGGSIAVACAYALVLLFVLRQWPHYRELFSHLFSRRAERDDR